MKININELNKFVSFQSVDNNDLGNKQAIRFVSDTLCNMGFNCRISGQNDTDQPTIIAHYPGRKSKKKIVIYGHYDVAPIDKTEEWKSQDPFLLQEIGGRYFARGIADNKGPLLARLEAVSNLINTDQAVPEILWLIQGEEEVESDDRVANNIFSHEITRFGANVFIEETGFNNIDNNQQIAFLWSTGRTESNLTEWHPLLENSLETPVIEYRHLNKFNGIAACPLLGNLPKDAVYIGFGPNDKLHHIHREDESLDITKLHLHKQQFKEFLGQYAVYSCN